MARPIPKHTLIHEVEYHEYEGERFTDGPAYKDPVIIKFVRLEFGSSVVMSADRKDILYDSLMFVDAKHSKPIPEFVEDSKVVFKGKELYIKKVNPVYARKLHHYEIGLI